MGKKTRQARERLKSGQFKLPSPKEVRDAMTPAGAWTARQLAEWGVDWPPPRGWRRELHLQWEALNGPPKVEIPETSGNDPRQTVIGNPPYQFILTPLADGEISIMTHRGEGGHFDEDDFSEWVAEFVATETKTKTLRVSFDDETFAAINDLIEGTHVTISEMVHTLVCIGLDELSKSFPGEVERADNDRLRILISDIQGFSQTPTGLLSIDELDRLDQNISERIAAEIDHQDT